MAKRKPMVQRLLEEIRDRNGMTHEEIVKYIVVDLQGLKWRDYHTHRGVWSINLYLNYGRLGVLKQFCLKAPSGKWVINEPIQAPFYRTTPTETFRLNKERIAYEKKVKEAKARCNNPNCYSNRHNHFDRWQRVKLGNACIEKTLSINTDGYPVIVSDCLGQKHYIRLSIN